MKFCTHGQIWSHTSGVAFWSGPMKSWRGGVGSPNSTHKNTPYRLDKLRSALAEAQLKRRKHFSRITGARFLTVSV